MKKKNKKKELSTKVKVLIVIGIVILSNILLCFGNRLYHLNRRIYVESNYDVLEYKLEAFKEKVDKIAALEEGVYTDDELLDIQIYFNNYYNTFSESKVLDIQKDGYYSNKYMLDIILDTTLLDYSNNLMHDEYMILDYIGVDKDKIRNVIINNDYSQKTLIRYLEYAVDNGSSKILSGLNPFKIEPGDNNYDYDSYGIIFSSELDKCLLLADAVLDKAEGNN